MTETYFHGTDVELKPGDLIDGDLHGYAYAATDADVADDIAVDHAHAVTADGTVTSGYVYEVEPVEANSLEPDGEYDDGIAYRSTAGFRVVRLVKVIP